MKPGLRYALLGLAAYLVFLIAVMPAHWAVRFLPREVETAGVSGSVWHGHAARIRYAGYRLDDVDWRVRAPYRLLWAQLPLRLRIEKGSVSGFTSLVLSPRSLTLEDSDLNINLEVFERALRRFRVHLGGMPVHLAAETLELRRAGPGAARGTMRWDQAAVRSPVALSLGTLNLDLSDAEGGWVGALSNDSQEIRIGGRIRVGEGWAWSSEIRLAPGPRADERLRQALPLLGQPDRSGTVVLKASGRLASTPQG